MESGSRFVRIVDLGMGPVAEFMDDACFASYPRKRVKAFDRPALEARVKNLRRYDVATPQEDAALAMLPGFTPPPP